MTALKTISLRLTKTKAELQDMGEDADGAATSISAMRDTILGLTNQKVDILDGDSYKSTYDIVKAIAGEWDHISQMNQQGLLYTLGGSNHANVIASMITNFDDVERALETSQNAAGSAMKENAKYLDSMEGKLAQFDSAMQQLSAHTFEADFLKGFIGGGTDMITMLDNIAQKGQLIPTVFGAASAALSAFGNIGFLQMRNFATGFKGLTDATFTGAGSNFWKKRLTTKNGSAQTSGWFGNIDLFGTGMTANDLRTAKEYRQILKDAFPGKTLTFTAQDRAGVEVMNAKLAEMAQQGKSVQQSIPVAFKAAEDAGQPLNNQIKTITESMNGLSKTTKNLGDGQTIVPLNAKALDQVSTKGSFWGNIGKSVLMGFGNGLMSFGISAAIQGIMTLGEYLVNWDSHQIQEGLEVINKYRDAVSSFKSNTASLEGMRSEFDTLSDGVDSMGRNISLSTDEYARYQEIVSQIAAMSPELVSSYDAEGNALMERNGLIDAAIEKQKEYKAAAAQELMENEHEVAEMYTSRLKEAGKAQTDAINEIVKASGLSLEGFHESIAGKDFDKDNLGEYRTAWLEYINNAEKAGQITSEQARAGRVALQGLTSAWNEASAASAEMKEHLSAYADQLVTAMGDQEDFSAEQTKMVQDAIGTEFWKLGTPANATDEEKMAHYKKQIDELVAGISQLDDTTITNIGAVSTQFEEGSVGAEEFKSNVEEIVAVIADLTGMDPDAVAQAFGFDTMLDETERLLASLDEIQTKTEGIMGRDTFSNMADARKGNALYKSLDRLYGEDAVPLEIVQKLSNAFKSGTPQASEYIQSVQKLRDLASEGNWGTTNFEKALDFFDGADIDKMGDFISGFEECNRLISELGLTAEENQGDINKLVETFLDTDLGSKFNQLNEMFDRSQIDSGTYDRIYQGLLEQAQQISGIDFGDVGDRLLKSLKPGEVAQALSDLGQSMKDFYNADPSQRPFMTDKLSNDLESFSENIQKAKAAHDVQRYNDFTRLYAQGTRALEIATDPVGRMTDAITRSTAAMQEQISTGRVSLETYQALSAMGPEYAATMQVSSGAITLNTEALKKLTAQEKEARIAELQALQNGAVGEYQRKAAALQELYAMRERGEASLADLARITSGEAELSQLAQLIQMYGTEVAAINEVAGARAALDAILSGASASEDFMNSWGKLPELLKGYEEEGKWGSVKRALETVFTDVPTDIPGLRAMSKQIKGLESDVEFFDFSWDKVKKALNDGSFQGLSWVDDATGQFHIYEAELKALSEATGLTMDFLRESFNIAADYDPEYIASLGGEEFVADLKRKIPDAIKEVEGETQIAVDALKSVFESGDWTAESIAAMIDKCRELGITFVDAEGNALSLSSACDTLGVSVAQLNQSTAQSRAYWQEMIQGCNSFSSAVTTLADGTKQLDLNGFKATAEAFGKSSVDMFGMLGELSEQGYTFTIGAETYGLDEARQKLGLTQISYDEFKSAISDPAVMNSPTVDMSNFIQSLNLTEDQLREFKQMAQEAGDEQVEVAIDAVLNAPSENDAASLLAGPIAEAAGKLAELQVGIEKVVQLKVGEDAWGIPSAAQQAQEGVDKLVESFEKISESSVSTDIDTLSTSLSNLGSSGAGTAATDIDSLAAALERAGQAVSALQMADPTTTLGALTSIGAYGSMGSTEMLSSLATNIDRATASIQNLSMVNPESIATGMNNMATALSNAGTALQTFQSASTGDLGTSLSTMATDCTQLSSSLDQVASSAQKFTGGNLKQFGSDLDDVTKSAEELADTLGEIEELDIQVNADSIEDALESMEELQEAYDTLAESLGEIEATAPQMDVSQLVGAIDEAIGKVEELRAYVESTGATQLTATIDVIINPPDISPVTAAVAQANESIMSIQTSLQTISGFTMDGGAWGIPASAEEARAMVEEAATEIINYLNEISATQVTIDTSAAQASLSALAGSAQSATSAVNGLISAIQRFNATPVKAKTASVSTGGHAKGIKNAPSSHMALVNDGAPVNGSSAELIIKGGTNEAYIANGGKLGMAYIEKGDTVLTAAETQKVFNGGSDLRYKRFGGGKSPSTIKKEAGTSKKKSTGSSRSSGSSSSGQSKSQIASEAKEEAKSDTEARKEEWEKYYKKLKHMRAMDEIDDAEYRSRLLSGMQQYLAGCSDLEEEYWSAEEEAYSLQKKMWEENHDKEIKEIERQKDYDIKSTREAAEAKLAINRKYYENNKLYAEEWKDAQVNYYKEIISATDEELNLLLQHIQNLRDMDLIDDQTLINMKRDAYATAHNSNVNHYTKNGEIEKTQAALYKEQKALDEKNTKEALSELRHLHDLKQISDADFIKALDRFNQEHYANNKDYLSDYQSISKEVFDYYFNKMKEVSDTNMAHLQYRMTKGDAASWGDAYSQIVAQIQKDLDNQLITATEAQEKFQNLWDTMHDTYLQTYDTAFDWIMNQFDQGIDYLNKQLDKKLHPMEEEVYQWKLEKDALSHQKEEYDYQKDLDLRPIQDEVWNLTRREEDLTRQYRDLLKPYQDEQKAKLKEQAEVQRAQELAYRPIDRELNALSRQSTHINKDYEKRLKPLQKELKALQRQNELEKEGIDLDKKRFELAKAQAERTNLVYRAGRGFVYEADRDKIRQLEEEINGDVAEKRIKELQRQIEDLQNERDEALEPIEDRTYELTEMRLDLEEYFNNILEPLADSLYDLGNLITEIEEERDKLLETISLRQETLQRMQDDINRAADMFYRGLDDQIWELDEKIYHQELEMEALNKHYEDQIYLIEQQRDRWDEIINRIELANQAMAAQKVFGWGLGDPSDPDFLAFDPTKNYNAIAQVIKMFAQSNYDDTAFIRLMDKYLAPQYRQNAQDFIEAGTVDYSKSVMENEIRLTNAIEGLFGTEIFRELPKVNSDIKEKVQAIYEQLKAGDITWEKFSNYLQYYSQISKLEVAELIEAVFGKGKSLIDLLSEYNQAAQSLEFKVSQLLAKVEEGKILSLEEIQILKEGLEKGLLSITEFTAASKLAQDDYYNATDSLRDLVNRIIGGVEVTVEDFKTFSTLMEKGLISQTEYSKFISIFYETFKKNGQITIGHVSSIAAWAEKGFGVSEDVNKWAAVLNNQAEKRQEFQQAQAAIVDKNYNIVINNQNTTNNKLQELQDLNQKYNESSHIDALKGNEYAYKLVEISQKMASGQMDTNEGIKQILAAVTSGLGVSTFDVPGYASGRKSGSGGLAITQELGPEAIAAKGASGRFTFLSPGDMVFSNRQTEALWKLSNFDLVKVAPDTDLSVPRIETKQTQNVNYTVSVGDVVLHGVEDTNALSKAIIHRLPNQMLQDLGSR